MNIIQITPGAGKMYCGNCFRDNALVTALRKDGHQVTMVPLYLPLMLDEENQSDDSPIFYNGVNVYLEQKSPFYRNAPNWVQAAVTPPITFGVLAILYFLFPGSIRSGLKTR